MKGETFNIMRIFRSMINVGYTKMLGECLKGKKCVIVVAQLKDINQFYNLGIQRNGLIKFVPLTGNIDFLRGMREPIFFDNHALNIIFGDVEVKINDLKSQIYELQKKLNAIKKIVG